MVARPLVAAPTPRVRRHGGPATSAPPVERPQEQHRHDRHGPSGYLPGLDGMRALAVIAVVLYHAGAGWLPGGFLGVDVFFVISGYIITRGLLAEWHAGRSIDLPRFWMRRARRLLPAVVALFSVLAAWTALFDDGEVASLRHDMAAGLTYVMNWYLILDEQSYFESFGRPSALQHLWSLAIEEQFYIAWPIVLGLGLRWLQRPALVAAICAGAGASALLMVVLFLHGTPADELYYRTDTRASALLVGALLAFAPAVAIQVPLKDALGVLAIGLLGFGFAWMHEDRAALYTGGLALVAAASALLTLAAADNASYTARLLGTGALRWIGLRSYAIYLWHWPIMAYTRPNLDVPLDGPALMALQIAGTLIIADVSYRLIERPIRYGALGRLWDASRAARVPARTLLAGGALAAASTGATALAVTFVRTDAPGQPQYVSSAASVAHLDPLRGFADVAQPITQAPPAGSSPAPLHAGASDAPPSSASDAGVLPGRSVSSSVAPGARSAITLAPPGATSRITAIGDSVMAGAAGALSAAGGGIYVDAEVGRQVSSAIDLLEAMARDGALGDTVVLHIGNNGTFSAGQFDEIMRVAGGDRRVVFVTLRVPRDWESPNNDVIRAGVARYANAVLADWHASSATRPEMFWDDRTHLRPAGAEVYVSMIIAQVDPRGAG